MEPSLDTENARVSSAVTASAVTDSLYRHTSPMTHQRTVCPWGITECHGGTQCWKQWQARRRGAHLWHLVKRPLVLAPAELSWRASGTRTCAAIRLCMWPMACRQGRPNQASVGTHAVYAARCCRLILILRETVPSGVRGPPPPWLAGAAALIGHHDRQPRPPHLWCIGACTQHLVLIGYTAALS
jgi:hypothetical protein